MCILGGFDYFVTRCRHLCVFSSNDISIPERDRQTDLAPPTSSTRDVYVTSSDRFNSNAHERVSRSETAKTEGGKESYRRDQVL